MLRSVCPKLPMRNKKVTYDYYTGKLGFKVVGNAEYDDYLMLEKEQIEIHFFKFEELKPKENYGQVYIRTDNIDLLYKSFLENDVSIHPNGHLEEKPWGQKEFSILDPDINLLTFGQRI
ncbi:MAG: VOC family protein [Eudoraea sp.]|nr:VOC family protein [Eudoraea sp.]